MTIRSALKNAIQQLTLIPTARLDAQILLCHVLGVEKPYLIAHDDRVLTDEEMKVYSGSFSMISEWDNEHLLVLSSNEVSLMTTVGALGVADLPQKPIVSTYPNPSSGLINISFDEEISTTQLVVNSLNGKEVYRQAVCGQNISLDLSTLARGSYVLQIKDQDDQTIYTHKLTIID